MMNRNRKVKLELKVSEAVALYYAAGALRDDIICASDKTRATAYQASESGTTDGVVVWVAVAVSE